MEYLIWGIKIGIFISIINVWFFRFKKTTPFRGGKANSMPQEFEAYGLPESFLYVIGPLKVGSALALFISIWMPEFTVYPAAIMAVLMLGAIFMHLKIKDPLNKAIPAAIFLILSLILIWDASSSFA
ncbi:DoxX family protein [Croceitalea vernalis]|uniref:DoxX family protein n=1 Tax=Croceitalea vernalis TaxID=3075599 RepID=A0ABU3BEP7_9FLAO|nr:DoxX family protein [Croceitalea sp. P007]MDT0620631.1 DoxX family protein [Croceitalea sp. P007]